MDIANQPLATPEAPPAVNMPMEVEVPDEQAGDMPDNPEGEGDLSQAGFGDNLAESLPESKLSTIATELVDDFERDVRSRSDWEKAYIAGLDYLGMKVEERSDPWEGACGVYHPLLTEAVVRFQSQAIIEIFPAAGPARTKILGKIGDPEKMQLAQRVEDEMNFILTERMTEYRNETEQLLFRLPLTGSVFRKIYFDVIEQRPAAIMVPAEDFVINYGASDLKTAERFCHVMKRTKNELKRLMSSGFYRKIDIPTPSPEYSNTEKAHDKLQGVRPVVETDDRHKILEFHTDYDIGEDPDEVALPYVITIEKSSKKVLGIRRNWKEEDKAKIKIIHFSHYQYMPGMGFYGTGLVHMIGGLAKSATSVLRQLVDAGTIANLPSGFKAKGLRIKNDGDPLSPGEFRDVDIAAGSLRDSILPLPVKEPSATLYSLLGTLVDEGRRIASIADLDVGDMSAQAPVGTTLALMERSLKIMSAVHARLHAALKDELRLISKIIAQVMPPQYDWDSQGEFDRQKDFQAAQIDIIPVSDPNASTLAQRVVQYQAVFQMATAAPEIYNLPLLHRKGLEAMQVKDGDQLIPMPDNQAPTDPITENMGFLTGMPAKAFPEQDQDAHITAHMAFLSDPKIQEMMGQSPSAARFQASVEGHIAEHLGFQYRQQIETEMGVKLPPPEEPLPPDIENKLSGLVADAANRLLYKHQKEAAAQKAEQLANDPVFQIQLREIALKEQEFAHKQKMDLGKFDEKALDRQSAEAQTSIKVAADLVKAGADRDAAMEQNAVKAGVDLYKAQKSMEASASTR